MALAGRGGRDTLRLRGWPVTEGLVSDNGVDRELTEAEQAKAADFSLRLREVVGQELRLVPGADGTSGTWSLNAGDIPVAHLRFGHDGWALDVACKEEQWRLAKHKRFGWELNLERPDGVCLGSYHGRRWRAGGSIELADGTRAELRRSLLRSNWQIQNPHGAVCEILSRAADPRISLLPGLRGVSMTVTIDPEPTGSASLHLVVLTACGVVLLHDLLAAAAAAADLGR
jgi:hypothetical protein